MKHKSRLSLALHTLAHMASNPDYVRTSAAIADHAQTNPVVVRRVLGQLRKAGLLHSQKGHAGGWRLARDPKNISLADIYLVLDERLVARGEQKGSSQCSVELSLQARIAGLLQEIEKNLLERLQETSIAELQQGEDIKTRHL